MGTNCGIYWIINQCEKKSCSHCQSFKALMHQPMSAKELADTLLLLKAIHKKGYEFAGWRDLKYIPEICQCDQNDTTDRIFFTLD
jgi:hypothetical protein